jgi:hypothetical protein
MKPDIYDLVAMLGLGMLGVGVGMINLAAALAVVGAILLGLGIFLASRRAK